MQGRVAIGILAALIAVLTVGCQKKLTEEEKNAPPPAGPHGEKIVPGAGSGGGGTGGGPGTGGAPPRR